MENQISHCFIQYLISNGIVTHKRLLNIMKKAQSQELSFISCLISDEMVDSSHLLSGLAHIFCLPIVDLDKVSLAEIPKDIIEEKLLEKYQVLPLWQKNEKLGLGITDPTQQSIIEDISFHTELIIEKFLVDPEKLKVLIKKILKKPDFFSKKIGKDKFFVEGRTTSNSFNLKLKQKNMLQTAHDDNEIAIIEIVSRLLQLAIERGASDIHVEPYQSLLQVRFRIDGLLYKVDTFSIDLTQRIVTRLKIMSQLDIAERRIPQDGRFQITDLNDKIIDCRISICPTLYGEKIVIRILDNSKVLLQIDKLGMDEVQKKCFLQALQCPYGMVLVTGPTGSGKTVTLYTALNYLNTSLLNISSVENPVEIVLPGINQVNINPKIGLNFSKVLRAFLRQDPDVMMVGEIRDQETAEIGIKAAQTGHLVLSSLHTNNAVESLVRLVSMGIPAYNIASCLHLIIAQRLARRLCHYCKKKDQLPNEILLQLGLISIDTKNNNLFTANGCEKCTDGYRGRIGIFEMLLMTDEIKNLLLKNYSSQQITLRAQKKGMKTLYFSALDKLKQGEISLLEMKRIIKD